MEDIDIYRLAGQVLGTLNRELNDGIYAKLGGELSIGWREGRKFGAYASSSADPAAPIRHSITIYPIFLSCLAQNHASACSIKLFV